jgi:hypothetical protein
MYKHYYDMIRRSKNRGFELPPDPVRLSDPNATTPGTCVLPNGPDRFVKGQIYAIPQYEAPCTPNVRRVQILAPQGSKMVLVDEMDV